MELKRISDLLWKVSPNTYFLSVILGLVTGLFHSVLIPFVIYAISTNVDEAIAGSERTFSLFDSPTATLAQAFLLTCLLIVLIKAVSTTLSMYVANRASVEHRLWLYRRIRSHSLADLERIGQARLINILNIDIPAITNAAVSLPQMWISAVTVTGVLGYLVHLNPKVFGFVLGSLVLAVLTYQLPMLFVSGFFRRGRASYDRVQQGVAGLIYGAKELKLNSEKSEAFYQHELVTPEFRSLKDNMKGNALLIFSENYGEILSFLVVAVVVFHFRYVFALQHGELLGISMALLYLTGPVSTILSVMANVQHGKVSLRSLQHFYDELSADGAEVAGDTAPAPAAHWDAIHVEDVSYAYGGAFAVRNVSLQIMRGEVTFIIGGNGSGKSTLGKCLALLYTPTSGRIRIGEQPVTPANIGACRTLVSAIFPDYFLFQKLYSAAGPERKADIARYLAYLELDHKVTVTDDAFSTTELSEGQRKRLALLVMLMEERAICIFDEWAADQDPRFKEIFYAVILRDLKARGKTVIVVSHDDRYFDSADQIITMESGVLLGAVRPPPARERLVANR